MTGSPYNDAKRPGLLRRIGRLLKRTVQLLVFLVLIYALICLVGMLPVNRDFQPHAEQDGITIYVYADLVHSEIMVPLVTDQTDWRELFPAEHFRDPPAYADGPSTENSYLAIGWGDRKFYTETPRWADIKTATTLRAMLLPTKCIVHVHHLDPPEAGKHCCRVTISPEQYRRLVKFLQDSFRRDSKGELELLANVSYGDSDAFYHATGRYHLLNTCNSWTGRGLKAAGVKTGLLTIAPQGILWHLPTEQ